MKQILTFFNKRIREYYKFSMILVPKLGQLNIIEIIIIIKKKKC